MSSDPKADSLFVDVKPSGSAKGTTGGASVPKAKDSRKRWLYMGLGAVVFVVVASTLFQSKPPAPPQRQQPNTLIDVTPKNINERSWQVQSESQLKQVQDQNDQLAGQVKALQDQIQQLKKAPPTATVPSGVVPPPTADTPSTAAPKSGPVPPPPVVAPGVSNLSQPGLPNGIQGSGAEPPPIPPPYENGTAAEEPLVFAPSSSSSSAAPANVVPVKVHYKKNTESGEMVAGAFAPVVLLNGIDAATSSGARSNPLPVLMRVQDNAILPGSSHYQIRSCFLLGSGYGDLSSERVYIRLARLSCVDAHDRLVLSEPVQGYIVDSDNTLGMRGKVVDRQGARLGKSMLAGFAQGLSNALGGAQGTITSSVLGSATTLNGSEALRASGLAGVSNAASQLAQFYLREAEAIFPVIEVSGGRTASVVFTQDVDLHWGNVDAQFVRDVEPTNK